MHVLLALGGAYHLRNRLIVPQPKVNHFLILLGHFLLLTLDGLAAVVKHHYTIIAEFPSGIAGHELVRV
jgi:hypothetical protein